MRTASRRVTGTVVVLALVLVGCSRTDGSDVTSSTTPGSPTSTTHPIPTAGAYPIVDTGQATSYDTHREIDAPSPGEPFFGQDSQHAGNQASYRDNGDGTVSDLVTGLMWTQIPDLDGDGDIDVDDKLTFDQAAASASSVTIGGYDDWRLPTIKEL